MTKEDECDSCIQGNQPYSIYIMDGEHLKKNRKKNEATNSCLMNRKVYNTFTVCKESLEFNAVEDNVLFSSLSLFISCQIPFLEQKEIFFLYQIRKKLFRIYKPLTKILFVFRYSQNQTWFEMQDFSYHLANLVGFVF